MLETRDEILDNLAGDICDEAVLFNTKLVLDELMSNAIKHGNKNQVHKKVHLNVEVHNQTLVIQVKDEGSGLSDVGLPHEPFANMDEFGRGLVLVNALADELSIHNNRVRAVLRF
jgi:anti-sigma regulatory factor (Ser/Thr protein kinase)